MSSVRRKRKPDTVRLNLVTRVKQHSVKLRKVSAPIVQGPAHQTGCGSRLNVVAGLGAKVFSEGDVNDDDDPDFLSSHVDSGVGVTEHHHRKQQKSEAWEKVRQPLLTTSISSYCIPDLALCVCCAAASAATLCTDCGPAAYYCKECAVKVHSTINITHTPMLWKDNMFVPLKRPLVRMSSPRCACVKGTQRVITIISIDGTQVDVMVEFCQCKTEAETLVELRLWPATPTRPNLAFTFELLDFLEALLLECQVPLKDFTEAMNIMCKVSSEKPKKVYPTIIDAFEEYRFMKGELRSLHSICPGRSKDTQCPACPQEDGSVFYSIDALFGLCRKKTAGSSVRPPLHMGTFFESQEEVKSFVDNYKTSSKSFPNECNEFLAGNALRSKSRFHALDETAVIGMCCRHEFPHRFFSIHHGERIGYIVYALEKLKEQTESRGLQVHVLYDVACLLRSHLQSQNREDLLSFFKLAIPVFHVYGHRAECQLSLSPRHLEGFGLTDGEVMERLWSFLRRFSRMTKEMRPSHREDVLTDALLYYGRKTKANLGRLLVHRLKNVEKVLVSTEQELGCMITNAPVKFDQSDIQRWIAEEQPSLCQPAPEPERTWEDEYVETLDIYYEVKCRVEKLSGESLLLAMSQAQRLDKRLQGLEHKYHLGQRWTPGSVRYAAIQERRRQHKEKKILQGLATCSRERWFLLSLKAKYADGQAIATRLSKTITKKSAELKKFLTSYNQVTCKCLTWEEVTDLTSELWLFGVLDNPIRIPKSVKLNAIRLFHRCQRCKEERDLLKMEMGNAVLFAQRDRQYLLAAINDLSTSERSDYEMGAIAHLKRALYKTEKLLHSYEIAFRPYIDVSDVEYYFTNLINARTEHPIYDEDPSSLEEEDSFSCEAEGGDDDEEEDEEEEDEEEEEEEEEELQETEDPLFQEYYSDDYLNESSGNDDDTTYIGDVEDYDSSSGMEEEGANIQYPRHGEHVSTTASHTTAPVVETPPKSILQVTATDSSDEDEVELTYELLKRKRRFEMQEFLQQASFQETSTSLLTEEDQLFLDKHVREAKGDPRERRSSSYLTWSKERLQHAVNISAHNLAQDRSRSIAKGYYFTKQ